MADKITIDMGDAPAKPTAFEALEKIGRFVVKMQEQDAKMQRIAQTFIVPDNTLKIDTDAIYRSVAEYKADPIIPEGYFKKTQEYQQKSLEVLQSINENTANLYTMVELIKQNNEKQDELISLMTETLSLAKAKDKAEAESMFKKIMGKITDTVESADSIIKIAGWVTTVYNMVLPMLK